jgi:murein DD-endopeptidase MepM/ murein hydrolase activator NlpD
MKKISKLIVFILIVLLISYNPVKAETLRTLKDKLDKTLIELKENETQTKLTEQDIKNTRASINTARTNITNMSNEMVKLTEEITSLEKDILSKEEEIKKIMSYVQVSTGENAYLEYAFGAEDFTDFIYRASIAEQMTKYNDELIKEFTGMISANNKRKEELKQKQTKLEEQQVLLSRNLARLSNKLDELSDETMSIEDEIKMQKEIIKVYEDRGCKLDEDIRTCGRATLPTTTQLYRPIMSGYVTSEFGNRCFMLNGKRRCDFHSGIDLSTNSPGEVNVYAAGTGMVVGITYRSSCGGNRVYVQHKFRNGKTYTTSYVHLRTVNVKEGQVVTRDTVIGLMGGDPSREWWDKCSTGRHLHFSIASGLYLTDYTSWSTYQSKQMNPRLVINFPSGTRNWFYDRISKY